MFAAFKIPVLAVRPEPGLSATLKLGRHMGLDMHGYPLSEVEPVDWSVPDLSQYDALLIGSANAMRMGGEKLSQLTGLPVHAVGEATAREARAAGFTVERTGRGGLQTIIDAVPQPHRYLRLVGNEYVDLNLPEGITFEPLQVYTVSPRPFPEEATALLRKQLIVLLHSAAMMRQFESECDRLEIERKRITLAAMGPRIASAAGKGWRSIHTPEHPSDEALLAMVDDLCQ